MIKTKKDLRLYLEEDRKRNGIPKSWVGYVLRLMAGREHAYVYRYLRCLRHMEYHMNNSKLSLWHKLWYQFYSIKNQYWDRNITSVSIQTHVDMDCVLCIFLEGGAFY